MLEVINLRKTYESQSLLKGISFSLDAGETVCLLGPSGSGKSTILRIIAGLEQAEGGDVLWDGHSLATMPVHRRNFGLMFQDYALFPHLNVFENVAYGLRMQNQSENKTKARVAETLAQVNMTAFAKRQVSDLSGGEQQRVALARALAPGPRLLMLDEPLGALDRALRESLLGELRAILQHNRIPAIYVTHDQQEAFTIADRIVILHDGEIAQAGSPADVFAKPAGAWIVRFLGLGNLVEAQVTSHGAQTPFGEITIDHNRPVGEKVLLLLRPQAEVVQAGETLSGRVDDVVFQGQAFRLELEHGLYFYVSDEIKKGSMVKLKLLKMEFI